jgi:hypothetical protein
MTDRYTKTVLTVIAAALVGLLAVQLTPTAHAQGTYSCGSPNDPCYVRTGLTALDVHQE